MGNIVHLYYGPPQTYPNWYHRYMFISSAGVEGDSDAYYNGQFSWSQDPHCVDSDGNIYIAGKWAEKIYKLDSEGNLLVEIDYDTATQCAITIDEDLWFYEWDAGGDSALRKRDKTTLAMLDEFSIPGNDYTGMAFDADNNVYLIDYGQDRIEKYNVATKSFVKRRDLPAGGLADNSIFCSLAVLDDVVYLANWNADFLGPGYIYSCPTDLSSDFTANAVDEFSVNRDAIDVITAFEGTHIVVVGEVRGSGEKRIIKYDSSFNAVWTTDVVYTGSELGVAAFPFPIAVAYDYPIYPVIFPLRT